MTSELERRLSEATACPVCGKPIPHLAGEYPWQYRRRRFCSRSCGSIANNSRRAVAISERLERGREIDAVTGCWNWTGPTKADGYGRITVEGRAETTHRMAYRTWCGEIAHGLHVCHRCDNPKCINPAHLFLGTNADNTADRNQKSRQARGETNGRSKLTAAEAIAIRNSAEPVASLISKYGVAETTIGAIRSGRTWKHL